MFENPFQLNFTAPVSPYKFMKVLGRLAGKDLPPQMGYNYVKSGYIKTYLTDTGKKAITPEEQCRVARKYIAGQQKRAS